MREGDTEGFGVRGEGQGKGEGEGREWWNMGGGVEVNSRNKSRRNMRK